jgi:hypothetical protein
LHYDVQSQMSGATGTGGGAMGGLMSMVSRLFPYHATSNFTDLISRARS